MNDIQVMRASRIKNMLLLSLKKDWTLPQLAKQCEMNLFTTKSFVKKLIDLGYVKQMNETFFRCLIPSLNESNIDSFSNRMSTNWNLNIFRDPNAPRKIYDFTSVELLAECKRRKLIK